MGLLVLLLHFPWAKEAGVQWASGTMACLSVAAFAALGMLMLFDPSVRKLDFVHRKGREDGLSLSVEGQFSLRNTLMPER
jgi:hypothetical protein